VRPTRLPLAAVLALSGCALKGDVRRVEQQVQTLRIETARADSARAVELDRLLQSILVLLDDMQDTLAAQQRWLVVMRGEMRSDITELQRQLVQIQELTGQSQQRLTEMRTQLERRATMVGVAPTGPTDTTVMGAQPGLPPPDELFDISLTQLRRGSPQAARAGFTQFLQAYGGHRRAGDAQFFIGESWAGSDLDSAAAAYQAVVDSHPNSPRAPAALYKLGLVAEQRGNTAAARVFYNRVIAGYPHSEEAALARDKLNPGP